MLKKYLLPILIIVALAATSFPAQARAQDKKITLAFVPGVVDPFYQTMEVGIRQAAADFGVDVVVQIPQKFDPTVQTPIIQAVTAGKNVSALITAATDKDQMIPVLEAVDKA